MTLQPTLHKLIVETCERRSPERDEITLHDLRHLFASLLIRHGASVKTVQARLGHKSASETLDTYSHLWPDDDEQTRNILNEALTDLRKADSKFGVLDKT